MENIDEKLSALAKEVGINIDGAKIRRSSSRLCLGVEHGDYNGTSLFGVGTDRFIWLAYKPNDTNKVRLYSGNFPDDGLIEFEIGQVPPPQSKQISDSWARYPMGVDYVLAREGLAIRQGYDAVLLGNIPGGGMSRSASLSLNLILTLLEVNDITLDDNFKIVTLAQAVENVYVGSPCGLLDQIMIYYARDNMGTLYDPQTNAIDYVPLGQGADDVCFVILDTGTVRPGLEKSTYKIRRQECEDFGALLQSKGFNIQHLADINDEPTYEQIKDQFADSHPDMFARFDYIYRAQQRFDEMLTAWRQGDMEKVGRVFREDGLGLRDDYQISGPELETMCDIARSVPGVLGERMLGGGDKGAAGAIVRSEAVEALQQAVATQYPKKCPGFADSYAVHICRPVAGIISINK